MDNKLELLTRSAQYDICGYNGTSDEPAAPNRFIYNAALPRGGSCSLFKVLQTNVCFNDCAYCVNQVGRDCRRFSFEPYELARTFMDMRRKNLVRGLFLTSGISGTPAKSMEKMIDTVQILRYKFSYKGYIHLKIMPDSPFDCVEAACKVASRVSLNMEAPTSSHLAKLSTKKDLFNGIIERMRWVKSILKHYDGWTPSGQTTQFVVGASGETDQDLLNTTQALYREIGLRRVYFSGYNPVTGSRLEGLPASPSMREHRLYQADWLLRVYKFPFSEVRLALENNDYLSLSRDPKVVIAQKQPWLFPVDINRAGNDDLLRVPGIGPTSAARIIEARRERKINSLEQLKKMRVIVRRALPYIWYQGMLSIEKQLSFAPEFERDEKIASLAEACR